MPSSSLTPTESYFDEKAAGKAERFFARLLHHVKGEWAGRPFELLPWQSDQVIRPLFGWKRPDGSRKYRTCYVAIPRKNGKSTVSSGVALYLLFSDGEPGAEIYSAAADRLQAGIVFDAAKQMVESSPELRSRCKIYKREIVIEKTGSVYRVLSADAATKHGLNAHGIIFDELHAQQNRDLWDVLATSTGARRQPITLAITTAGYDRNSICWEIHDYASKVRDGIIQDDTFLPVLFGADQTDDWTVPATWKRANPSLGSTVKLDYLEQECRRAQEVPGYENTFKRLHLNIWTEQATRWLPIEKWDQGGEPFDLSSLDGQQCWAGLDLASTTDIAALQLAWPVGDEVFTWGWYFVPEDRIADRSRKDRVPYDVWARQGFIESTPGNVIDYEFIRAKVHELAERFPIREIGFDRWNASSIVTALTSDGFTMVPIGQGFVSMSAPAKELEKLVVSGKLRHGANPVLRWMASNVCVRQDPAGNLKPDKASSGEKIDGIVALCMALSRLMVSDQTDISDHYAKEGLMIL